MRILDERADIDSVAERWKSAYYREGKWSTLAKGESEKIYLKLEALNGNASREDVAAIIGNDSWIGKRCTECGEPAVILIGQEPDYESATVYLCARCVRLVSEYVKRKESHA